MFQLTIIEDKILISPDQLNRDPSQAIIEQIEIKYVNKVILNVGLGVAFFDFISIHEPYLYPGAGAAIQVVRFRLIVFRPFVGEVITARVSQLTKDGLKLSLDFFDDIHVAGIHMQEPSTYDELRRVWNWSYNESDASNTFTLEINDVVRFKVRSVSFTSVTTTAKGQLTATTTSEMQENNTTTAPKPMVEQVSHNAATTASSSTADAAGGALPLLRRRSSSIGLAPDSELPSAMQISGLMNDFGLGGLSWW